MAAIALLPFRYDLTGASRGDGEVWNCAPGGSHVLGRLQMDRIRFQRRLFNI
jgi:hypothetical protein